MCKLRFSVPIGFLVTFVGVMVTADEAKKPDSLAICFIHDRFVFAVDKGIEGRGEKGLNPSTIFKTSLTVKMKERRSSEQYHFWHRIVYDAPYRWRIAHGCFWGVGGTIESYECDGWRVPLDELRLMDLQTEEDKTLLHKKYPELIGQWLCVFEWDVGPTREIYWHNGGRFVNPPLKRPLLDPPLHYDFLPTGKTTTLLFVVGRGKMHVWEGTASYFKKRAKWEAKYKARKDLQMKADFSEPFFVYQADSVYYFATVSGKLYRSKLPKGLSKPKKEEGEVIPLWTDGHRPIRALITDTASNKTFAFTVPVGSDSKEEGYRYFALAEKIAPTPYEVKPLSDSKIPQALRQVLPYTDFLLREKEVK